MSEELIFRFLSVRSAKQKAGDFTTQAPLYSGLSTTSEVVTAVVKAQSEKQSSKKIKELASSFKTSTHYFSDKDEVPEKYRIFAKWCLDNIAKNIKIPNIKAEISQIFGVAPKDLIQSQEFKALETKLADTILVDTLVKDSTGHNLDDYVFFFKTLHLLKFLVSDQSSSGVFIVTGDFFSKILVKMPTKVQVKKEMPELPKKDAPAEPQSDQPLREKLNELAQAHKELTRITKDGSFKVEVPEPSSGGEEFPSSDSIGINTTFLGLINKNTNLDLNAAKIPLTFSLAASNISSASNSGKFLISEKAIQKLSSATKKTFDYINIDAKKTSPTKSISLIEREMTYLSSQLGSTLAIKEIIPMGIGYIDKNAFLKAIGKDRSSLEVVWDVLSRCKFEAGVGDLLIVRQKLKAYQLAEFAHVENVLAGESHEREHRRLNIREEIQIFDNERETEKERNLQSTERNEMQAEAEKTVKSQVELEAGLQVSGSYGPTVSFAASLNAGFSTQSEESQRKAVSYSREVTEKTSDKIRERVREQRTRRTLEEIEEINKHSVNNSNAANGHVRGVYRWLNKLYDAQVYNYGQRMMYEFVIPEPAAYILYSMIDNPPKKTTLIKPELPLFWNGYREVPLLPSNLSRSNYNEYVSQFHIANAPTPPSEFTVVSFFDKQDGKDPNNYGRASKLAIPEGYEAYAAMVSSYHTFIKDKEKGLKIMIGGVNIDRSYWGAVYYPLDEVYRGEISIAVGCFQLTSFVVSVDVFCSLSDEAFAKWQQKMYDSIIEAYNIQKADYEEKLAQAEIQAGIKVLGQNPLENRRVEREEMKKWIVMMLNNSPYISLNSFDSSSLEPILNIERACQEGSFIRFFENAFEWNNMTYVFYPYFWGRKAKWANALHLTDPDPDFAAFLKAGAARVQVPVRPGFERAIAHFCQYGEIWEGNEAPLREDDLYVPIINEITENLGKIEGGVPYPEGSTPWEVVVPTSLVVLQDLDEISGIVDVLTGQKIDLQNKVTTP